ncbi:MAG: sigma 54-interacting transcriptional regulator [Candidatus Binatia bacterium]
MSDEASRLRLLYELGCAFATHLELDELLPEVVARCREALDAEGAAVLLLDPARDELYFPWADDEDPDVAERLLDLRFPADRGIAGAVLADGTPVRVDDAAADPRFYPGVDRSTGQRTRAMLVARLAGRQGPLGVIEIVNRRGGGTFGDDDLALLAALAGSVAVAIENARLWEQLKGSAARLEAEVGALRRDLARRERFGDMIGSTPSMAQVFRLMESAAASSITVLIEGETGTGKELVARGIHAASARANGPFVAVNCAALPETLLESELFGHRRGAFTGATQDRRGLFEAASGGTILLDEVGEMPLAMQAKLLRVLQEGEVTPVGDHRPHEIDVRVVSATNRDLLAEVGRRTFREDLYYRLGAFPILLPPLRARGEDVPLLADRFLQVAAARHGKPGLSLEPEALDLLVHYDWPGNVRQLQNEIERAVVLALAGQPIGPEQLSPRLARRDGGADAVPTAGEVAAGTSHLREAREVFEVAFVKRVLAEHAGNISRTAQALGISRVALQKKLREYGLR